MHFSLATAGQIIFGDGTIDLVGPQAARLGKRVLLVTGRTARHAATVSRRLAEAGLDSFSFVRGPGP
jgi:alcohol dehydrogenase class IV